ncbi:MAG: hypothetical protein E6R10_09655 [Rhodocyclaceae bacterium]|nr:MAG: hypothetical protein E6R10_09655 [Rhodocyclaceae bacterium]
MSGLIDAPRLGEGGRLRQIRWLALIVCVLSVLVVAVSAYLRLDAAGLGCTDWPACYGKVLAGEPAQLHYGVARLLHRLAASTALLLTIAMVWRCLRPYPLQPAARYAVLLLALMLALSALGFFSADPRRALVGFLNIVGGLGLVTFSWRTAMAAGACNRAVAPQRRHGPFLVGGAVLLTVAVLLGAWLGATYSAPACPTLPFCEIGAWAFPDALRALDPLRSLQAPALPGDSGGATLHLLHRGFAVLALIALGGLAVRRGQPAAKLAAGMLAGVVLLGVASVSSGLNLALVVAHGIAAALLLAVVATLLRR